MDKNFIEIIEVVGPARHIMYKSRIINKRYIVEVDNDGWITLFNDKKILFKGSYEEIKELLK